MRAVFKHNRLHKNCVIVVILTMPRRKVAILKSPIAKLRKECRAKIPHFRIRCDTAGEPRKTAPPRGRPKEKRFVASLPSASTSKTLASPALNSATLVSPTQNSAILASRTHNSAALASPACASPWTSATTTCSPLQSGNIAPTSVSLKPKTSTHLDSTLPKFSLGHNCATLTTAGNSRTRSVCTAEGVPRAHESSHRDTTNSNTTRRKLTKRGCLLADWETYEKDSQYHPTFFDRRRASEGNGTGGDGGHQPYPFNQQPSRHPTKLPPPKTNNRADFDHSDYVDNDGFVEIPDSVSSLSKNQRKPTRKTGKRPLGKW